MLGLQLSTSQRRWFLAVFVFIYSVVLSRFFLISIYDQWQGPGWKTGMPLPPMEHVQSWARGWFFGDAYSARNVHSAARYFKEFGFRHTYLLPVLGYDPAAGQGGSVYTHYPPLPDIIGGISGRVFGTEDPRQLMITPLLLSVFFFWLIFYTLQQMIPDRRAAFLSACLLVCSNYFIAYADDLHQHLYVELTKWLFVLFSFRYYEQLKTMQTRNWGLLAGLAGLFIVAANLSLEAIPILAVVSMGFAWTYRRSPVTPEVVLLGAASVVGFGLHVFQNYLYFGSWQAVYEDFHHAFVQRTTGEVGNELGRAIEPSDSYKYLALFVDRIGHFFVIAGLVFLPLSFRTWGPLGRLKPELRGLAITFFLAAIIWPMVMFQHAYVHIFTGKHLGLYFGLTAGLLVVRYTDWLITGWRSRNWQRVLLQVPVVAYVLYCFGLDTVYFLYLKFGWLYPHLGVDSFEVRPVWKQFLGL